MTLYEMHAGLPCHMCDSGCVQSWCRLSAAHLMAASRAARLSSPFSEVGTCTPFRECKAQGERPLWDHSMLRERQGRS